jgi:hypothetical protein
VPSLRLLSVVVLVGMGATVAAIGGIGESDSGLGGSVLAAQPQATATQTAARTATRTAAPTANPTATVASVPGTLTVDAAGTAGPTSGAAFDVRAENKRTGTPDWQISKARGTKAGLAGYLGAVSVLPGQSVPLFVSGTAAVRVRALRIGWYGGDGARQVWEGRLPAGQTEPAGSDPRSWQPAGSVDTTGWPEGHYLLRLDQGDAGRYLPLTVRSADNAGRVVVLTSPMTWAAENATGSALAASFDRPYTAGYGAAGFLTQDAGLVQLAERTGRRIGWVTDYDAATDPSLLAGAAAILTGGDSQYWPTTLRTTIQAAADAGTNLAFFGAGTGARRIGLIDAGRTVQIKAAKLVTSVQLTGLRPSCSVTLTAAEGSTGAEDAGWVVANSDWWGYADTGLKTNDVLPGLVSGRVDRAATTATGSDPEIQVLSFTRTTCANDAAPVAQSGVYLVRPSGAGVFAVGTGQWGCALTNACTDQSGAPVKLSKKTLRVTSRITRNIVRAFAEEAAGKQLTAEDTASQYAALR